MDACLVNATDFKTLQHPITHVFKKMFATNSAEVVTQCQQAFAFQPIIRNQRNCGKIQFFKATSLALIVYLPLLVINVIQMRYSILIAERLNV